MCCLRILPDLYESIPHHFRRISATISSTNPCCGVAKNGICQGAITTSVAEFIFHLVTKAVCRLTRVFYDFSQVFHQDS